MKSVLLWAATLSSLVMLTGCVIDDEQILIDEEENISRHSAPQTANSSSQDWKSFTFKSITGNEDLQVKRESNKDEILSISTSKYTEPFLAVAVYSKDCEVCQMQAAWFDKLAEEFPASSYGMNFIIIFLDVLEDSPTDEVAWVKELSNVDAYTNVAAMCSGGACHRVFTPYLPQTTAGTVYYVDKRDLTKTRQGITWDARSDQNDLYQIMRTQVANFMNLMPISFDASVEEWPNDTQYNEHF